jgi:hypothetical protein
MPLPLSNSTNVRFMTLQCRVYGEEKDRFQ